MAERAQSSGSRSANALQGVLRGGRLELRMLGLLVALAVILSLISPYFLTINNLSNVMDQSVVIGIVAVGQTFVILTAGIDLSVGSLVGFTGIVLGLAFAHFGIPGAVVAAVLAGAAAGLINGVIITKGRVAAFVVTLGMMSIARSQAYVLSGANSISSVPAGLGWLASGTVLGVPFNFAVLVVLYAGAWLFLTRSKGGRTLYAIGSNAEAARVAGLQVDRYRILPYIVSGVLSAVAAIFLSARILSIDPIAGTGLELDSIAAVVIGGTSLFGGRGSIVGTLIGVFIMVLIRNGLNLLNVSPYWQGTAIGSIIIAAVLAERLLSSRKGA